MAKLKKPRASIHGTLQNAVITAINDPNYSFSLPKLSDWESVVSSSVDEKQRLEFVGDAIMHLAVALYLYRLFPDAAPGLYTNIRSAVNTNATFTHLMVKAGAYELPSQSCSSKVAADSFEVIVAAHYFECGFAKVCEWVQEQYRPLIGAARESYDRCLIPCKRRKSSLEPANIPLLKKIRLLSGRSSPRRTLMARSVIKRMKSKGKVKLCRLRTPEPEGVIDLTLSDDEAPSQAPPGDVGPASHGSYENPIVVE